MPICAYSVDPHTVLENKQLAAKALAALTPRERQVVVSHIMDNATLCDVAIEDGRDVSSTRIQQINAKAIRKMREALGAPLESKLERERREQRERIEREACKISLERQRKRDCEDYEQSANAAIIRTIPQDMMRAARAINFAKIENAYWRSLLGAPMR